MISEEQLHNLNNELNEMMADKATKMFHNNKHGDKLENARAHVELTSLQNNSTCQYEQTFCGDSSTDSFLAMSQCGFDIQRRASAADAENLAFPHNLEPLHFNRRASADVEQHFLNAQNGNSSRKNFPNSFQEFWFSKFASNACSNLNIENLNSKPLHIKRRFSAADIETFPNSYSAFMQQPAALLSAAASSEIPRYWHVGPEMTTVVGARKKCCAGAEVDSVDCKQTNDVLRLFEMMRKLHDYLTDVVPSKSRSFNGYQYATHNEGPLAHSLMPSTKNIRTHVKHIIYQCNAFCHEKSRRLDEYHSADRQKYFECSRSIYVLRKLIKQLETFKTADFEHRKGAFIHSFAAAKAKNLEILLTQMIDKVRECSVCIENYRWSIQQNIMETGLTSMETLEKAIAIAAAMNIQQTKTNTKQNDKNDKTEQEGAWGGTSLVVGAADAAKIQNRENELLEDNIENQRINAHNEILNNALKTDFEASGTRLTKRYVGNFI